MISQGLVEILLEDIWFQKTILETEHLISFGILDDTFLRVIFKN